MGSFSGPWVVVETVRTLLQEGQTSKGIRISCAFFANFRAMGVERGHTEQHFDQRRMLSLSREACSRAVQFCTFFNHLVAK